MENAIWSCYLDQRILIMVQGAKLSILKLSVILDFSIFVIVFLLSLTS